MAILKSSTCYRCSKGIGFKIAERLFNDGFNVAIVDFNEEGAKKLLKHFQKKVKKQ